MDILIFTKKNNIKEIYNYIISKIPPNEGTRVNEREAIVYSNNFTIQIKKFNESARGYRSRVILYDGDFTKEEMITMQVKLIDTRHLPLNTEPLNEILLAPLKIFEVLLRDDVTYILNTGSYDYEAINYATKDFIRAIHMASEHDDFVSCFQNDIYPTHLCWQIDSSEVRGGIISNEVTEGLLNK